MQEETNATCEGLSVEGESENFVASLELIAQAFERRLGRKVNIHAKSDLGKVPTVEVMLNPHESAEIDVLCELKTSVNILTASTFCWTKGHDIDVGIGLTTEGNEIFRTFRSGAHHKRHEITLPHLSNIDRASFKLRLQNDGSESICACIAFPCVEAFPRASSPILPGTKRAADLVSLRDSSHLFSNKDRGTILLTFRPLLDFYHWCGIPNGILLGAKSENTNYEIYVYIAGDGGHLVLEAFDGNQRRYLTTTERPVTDDICALCLTWDVGRIELFINGNSQGVLQGINIDFTTLNRVRIGNHPDHELSSAYVNYRHVSAYLERFLEWKVKAALFEIEPVHFSFYASVLDGLSELSESRWPEKVIEKLFTTANSWQQYPPLWTAGEGLDEGVFRDDLSRFLVGEFPTTNEAQCADGRTDLLFELGDRKKVRIEFKIWGRHDYKRVPEKPMKYMTDAENIGIVVMLNTNKSNINRQYVFNVLTESPGCVSHVENPFRNQMGIFHFISEHFIDDRQVSILHVVFNTQKALNRDFRLKTNNLISN